MRVGLFGLLGAGNVGNDGLLEAVLVYLRTRHPDAELTCMCSGPDGVAERYGLPTTPLYWYYAAERRPALPVRVVLKLSGKVRDAVRMLRWVRRQDVVIVPGAGVLENTLPVRPWGFPFSMFLLCLFGRVTGRKVALVNVGCNVIRQPLIRALYRTAARLAHYRSFRDRLSRDSMAEMGVDTSGDDVFPDLVFSLPPPSAVVEPGTVGVGVMDFHGSSDDRHLAERINRSYLDALKAFVRWLVDDGRRVRLFIGDDMDRTVVAEVIADVRAHRPDLDPSTVVFDPVTTLGGLIGQMAAVDSVVATRYHNIVSALKLAKPTVSLSYSAKSDRIMAEMGLGEFCQDARSVDVDRLIEQFTAVEGQRDRLRPLLAERAAAKALEPAAQFARLDSVLFGMPEPVTDPAAARRAS